VEDPSHTALEATLRGGFDVDKGPDVQSALHSADLMTQHCLNVVNRRTSS
jgi:hypothetical protein